VTLKLIDHLVLPVADLGTARARLTALGFTVAPDALHPFGTANACIFLEDGTYLEPLGLADRRKAGQAAKRGNVFIERDLAFRAKKVREGFTAIVLSSGDAVADHARFVEHGISAGQMLQFARPMKMPDGSETEAAFHLAFAGMADVPDFLFFGCQRINAFPASRGGLQKHMNAVTGLSCVVLAARDPAAQRSLLEKVLDTSGEALGEGFLFDTENVAVRLAGDVEFDREFAAHTSAGGAAFAGRAVIFKSADLAVTEITLAANDVAFVRRDGRVLVYPAAGQGVLFGFEG
jgi:hypothetical protein